MEEKFLILDGSSLLNIAYYGNLPLSVKKAEREDKPYFYKDILQTTTGIYTNGVYLMLKAIFDFIRNEKPTHMAIVFDKSREDLFRKKIYPDYKGTRKDTPEPLIQQFETIEILLKKIGIKIFLEKGYEADDFAGSIAAKFHGTIPIRFITKDQDYLQLVEGDTRVWLIKKDIEAAKEMKTKYQLPQNNCPANMVEYTKELVKLEKGVYPYQIPDLKGIEGDTADNIPGVKNVAAAASVLLSYYSSLECLYEDIHLAISKEETKKLQEFWKTTLQISRSPFKSLTNEIDERTGKSVFETAILSKNLATIDLTIPIKESLSDFKINIKKQELLEELKKLEINNINLFHIV